VGHTSHRDAPRRIPLPASGEREGPAEREGEGQRATDLGRLGEENRLTGQPWFASEARQWLMLAHGRERRWLRCPVWFSATPARPSPETPVTPEQSESFEFESL
jgi:hypothetical protein